MRFMFPCSGEIVQRCSYKGGGAQSQQSLRRDLSNSDRPGGIHEIYETFQIKVLLLRIKRLTLS